MKPLRVVLDTNVLISGLCFGGLPARLLRLALTGRLELATSPPLIEEFKRVMELKFPHKQAAIEGTLAELSLLWEKVPASLLPRISAVAADPADDRVLECAVAARAEAIVSGDKHLLGLAQFRGIPILPPSLFIQRFKL